MKKKIELCMVLLLLIGAIVASKKLSELTAKVSKDKRNENQKVEEVQESSGEEKAVIVIDPGHGGEDPGKVGLNDVLEKDLNLQVAMKVEDLLDEAGISIVMTREDDNVPTAKMEDLKQRIALINRTKPALTLCIHQNSYTDPDIRGAQVFYYTPSEESKEVASIVQEELRNVDPTNKREIKANDTYYMLKNTKGPIIIVECGFLTNPEEAKKLTEEAYQDQMAMAICEGIIKWLDK